MVWDDFQRSANGKERDERNRLLLAVPMATRAVSSGRAPFG